MTTKSGRTRSPKRFSKLRWIMQYEGITTRFIAKRTGIKLSTLNKYITSPESFDATDREKLCKVLNRTSEEIFGEDRPLPQLMIARSFPERGQMSV